MRNFLLNGVKGISALLIALIVFIIILILFTLIGTVTAKSFPLGQAMLDNFHLLLILSVISVPLGFIVGNIAGQLKTKRVFFISLLGYIFHWLIIVLIILIFSEKNPSANIFVSTLRLSVQAMLAYSFYAVPVVMTAVFLLEKWTRKK